ncbi:MAG: lysylphosphatidylglycerol synthase transmembrane domain-containing protein [Magnetovibrionaceae bacterium]
MTALKVAVSVGLIYLVFRGVDLKAALARILSADPFYIVLACLTGIFQVGICGIRWRAVLSAIGVEFSFWISAKLYAIGLFFNLALPSSVGGDAVRGYKTYKRGVRLTTAISSVLLERVALVLALVLVVLAAAPILSASVGEAGGWIVPMALLLALGGLAGLCVLMLLDRLPSRFQHIRIVRSLGAMAGSARILFLKPRNLLPTMVWCVIGHLNIVLAVYFLALALGLGNEASFMICLGLVPPVILITTLPISIGGWGLREGAMVYAFGLVGVASDGALALSLLFGLLGIWIGLPGAIAWLIDGGSRKDLEEAEKLEEEAAS